MTDDKRKITPLNIVAFFLLVVVTALCAASFFSPYWLRLNLAWFELRVIGLYSLILNPTPAWIGLLGSCDTTQRCQAAINFHNYNTGSKSWYKATGALMGIGFCFHIIAFLIQCLFTCYCKCLPITPRLTTIAVAASLFIGCLFCIIALAIFGTQSYNDGLMNPLDLNGPDGSLDWGFFLGIIDISIGTFTTLLFVLDIFVQKRFQDRENKTAKTPASKAPPPYSSFVEAPTPNNSAPLTNEKSMTSSLNKSLSSSLDESRDGSRDVSRTSSHHETCV